MASRLILKQHGPVGAWAKRCYFAGRAAMEAMLRPFDLGTTQWYILHQLVHHGPTAQRDLVQWLQVERSTLTVIVRSLVRKGWAEQSVDKADQRRKLLRITPAGEELWATLPDLPAIINEAAFSGVDEAEMDVAVRVLRLATERLDAFTQKGHRE